tara:strand:- start:52 stop:387 length:336 start_codon:yes stop_codon:yes gene_type:complete
MYYNINSIFNELDQLAGPKFKSRSDEKHLIIEGALPGYDKKNLNIEVEDDYLTIKASTDQASSLVAESLNKCYKLPTSKLDTKKSAATYTNGILEVKIPYKKDVVKTIKVS